MSQHAIEKTIGIPAPALEQLAKASTVTAAGWFHEVNGDRPRD